MNILFVGMRTSQESVGVMKKLAGQRAAFERLGHRVWATDIDAAGGWLLHGEERIPLTKARRCFPAALAPHMTHARTVLAAARYAGVPFHLCYMRKPLCDGLHLRALAALRRRGVAVVEEIPTWPYDAELKSQNSLAGRAFLCIDRHFRRRLARYLSYIATYSYDAEILGLPTIQLDNAVDTDAIPMRVPPAPAQALRLCAVSSMFFWHGYDRLIAGMALYAAQPGARPVTLQLVGDGPERARWQRLAAERGLAKQVTFCGVQTGEALEQILAGCDVAVSSLGWYRKGIRAGFELKTREYIARGLPFVYACDDAAAEAVHPCSLRAPDDGSPLDVGAVVRFAEGLQGADCAARLQQYAKKHLRWETQMQKVTDACRDVLRN